MGVKVGTAEKLRKMSRRELELRFVNLMAKHRALRAEFRSMEQDRARAYHERVNAALDPRSFDPSKVEDLFQEAPLGPGAEEWLTPERFLNNGAPDGE